MEDILLAPPIAFAIYLVLTGVLTGFGRALAGPSTELTEMKISTYASGEAPPSRRCRSSRDSTSTNGAVGTR